MKFTDTLGRSWSLEIDYKTIKRVRTTLYIDLLSIIDKPTPGKPTLLEQLDSDPITLIDLIGVICEEQMQAKGITVDQFVAGLGGQALTDAMEALINGIANFSPPQKGQVIRKGWEKLRAQQEYTVAKFNAMVDSEQYQQMIHQQIRTIGQSHGIPVDLMDIEPPPMPKT